MQVWGAEGDQPELAGGAPPCWKRREMVISHHHVGSAGCGGRWPEYRKRSPWLEDLASEELVYLTPEKR